MQLYKGVPIISLSLQFPVRHFKIYFSNMMTVNVNIMCFDLAHDLSPDKVQALPHKTAVSGNKSLCLLTNVKMVFE